MSSNEPLFGFDLIQKKSIMEYVAAVVARLNP